MHATSRMLRPNLLAAATRARAPASARRSGLGARHIPGRPVQAFRCNAASLTSEDDATLEAEAERPTRIAQQVRRERPLFLRVPGFARRSNAREVVEGTNLAAAALFALSFFHSSLTTVAPLPLTSRIVYDKNERCFQTEPKQVRLVQWYPGHIARAEKLLREQLKAVDAVVEVRDIRIPLATTHPDIPEWIGSKLRVLVLNRADMVSDAERSKWVAWFKKNGETHVVLTDARSGKGVKRVAEVALLVSKEVNDKRIAKGLMPRPVRAAVIGYPNVGKSALINRLTKSKACASAPRPGVTRNLRWVRIGGDLDLLDSPGVLPPRLADQRAAARLAMANDIGEASYLASSVAAQLFEEMCSLERWDGKDSLRSVVEKRFKLESVKGMSGEDFVAAVAEKALSDDLERAGTRVLNDFRNGALGAFCLETAPGAKSSR
jgi:ribosome biogenesis GTP-binding protein YlqF